MILSEDRQSHWAHIITDGLWKDDLLDFSDDDVALRAAKKALVEYVRQQGDLDLTVRKKIQSLKKQVYEGSSEWDILYGKYFQEELVRRGNS
jgi:hypothetical protein